MKVHGWKPSAISFMNLPPYCDHILNVISLFFTFFDVSSGSIFVETTEGRSFTFFHTKSYSLQIFFAPLNLWLIGVQLEIKRMGKNKFKLYMSKNTQAE